MKLFTKTPTQCLALTVMGAILLPSLTTASVENRKARREMRQEQRQERKAMRQEHKQERKNLHKELREAKGHP